MVSLLKPVRAQGLPDADVPKMFNNDHAAELDAVRQYNASIQVRGDARDYATREILRRILRVEDSHVDSIEEAQDQISQMGLPMFLATQVK